MFLTSTELIFEINDMLDYILAYHIIFDICISFFLVCIGFILWKAYTAESFKDRFLKLFFYGSLFFFISSIINNVINISKVSKVLKNPKELKYICGNVNNYTYLGLPAREHFKINNIYFSFNEAILRNNIGSKEKIKNIKLAIYYVPEANNQAIKVYVVKNCGMLTSSISPDMELPL